MVGDTSLFWRSGLFLRKNRRNGSAQGSSFCFLVLGFVASVPAHCCSPHSSRLQTSAQTQARLRAGFGCPPCEPLPSTSPGHGSVTLPLLGHR